MAQPHMLTIYSACTLVRTIILPRSWSQAWPTGRVAIVEGGGGGRNSGRGCDDSGLRFVVVFLVILVLRV